MCYDAAEGRNFQQRKLDRETRSYAPKEPLSGSSSLGRRLRASALNANTHSRQLQSLHFWNSVRNSKRTGRRCTSMTLGKWHTIGAPLIYLHIRWEFDTSCSFTCLSCNSERMVIRSLTSRCNKPMHVIYCILHHILHHFLNKMFTALVFQI